MRTAATVS